MNKLKPYGGLFKRLCLSSCILPTLFVLMLVKIGLADNLTYAQWHEKESAVMGTRFYIQLQHPDAAAAQKIIHSIEAEFSRLDYLLSTYKSDSEISQINQHASQERVPLSSEAHHLIKTSIYYHKLTKGAFDITYAGIGKLYNYRSHIAPDQNMIELLKPAIGTHHLELKQNTLHFNHPKVAIDLGGIAKGYAIDQALSILKNHGIINASITAGGDSYFLGQHNSRPWHVGIRHPRDKTQTALMFPIKNAAVSTSGDYERYFEDNDKRHHHIIIPHKGISPSELVSVTVIGEKGIETDALSTGLFVMGIKEGLNLANQINDIDAIFIDASGLVHYTDQLMPPSASSSHTDPLNET